MLDRARLNERHVALVRLLVLEDQLEELAYQVWQLRGNLGLSEDDGPRAVLDREFGEQVVA